MGVSDQHNWEPLTPKELMFMVNGMGHVVCHSRMQKTIDLMEKSKKKSCDNDLEMALKWINDSLKMLGNIAFRFPQDGESTPGEYQSYLEYYMFSNPTFKIERFIWDGPNWHLLHKNTGTKIWIRWNGRPDWKGDKSSTEILGIILECLQSITLNEEKKKKKKKWKKETKHCRKC